MILQQDKAILQQIALNESDVKSNKGLSRNSSVVKFNTAGAAPVVLSTSESVKSLDNPSVINGLSEGTKKKAEMILRLRQKSEERSAKVEHTKALR